jgi:hypothetical protein
MRPQYQVRAEVENRHGRRTLRRLLVRDLESICGIGLHHGWQLALLLGGSLVALASFLLGLWSVFSDPGRGLMLMGLGIVMGVSFGRVRRGAGETLADEK